MAPYEYIDDDGNIVGTDILMCQWMAEQLGVELEVQPMAFDAASRLLARATWT
ncbi:MAG: transporter substrate-binding domain-containing protein [Christensenellales bacterium]